MNVGISRITRRDVIRSIPRRFKEQYGNYSPSKPLPWFRDGKTKAEVFGELDSLDTGACSPEEIDGIIRSNWSSLKCDECENEVGAVVRIGDEPDYEARWVDVCASCLSLASVTLEGE